MWMSYLKFMKQRNTLTSLFVPLFKNSKPNTTQNIYKNNKKFMNSNLSNQAKSEKSLFDYILWNVLSTGLYYKDFALLFYSLSMSIQSLRDFLLFFP